MHAFTGRLLNGKESFKWLIDACGGLSDDLRLCSAFMKASALEQIASHVPKAKKVRLLTRWKASDLLAKASDIRCYEIAKQLGWDFYIKPDFHGKIYWVPDNGILVGSWNATASGFGLNAHPNDEIGTLVAENKYNTSVVDAYFENAVKVIDDLYGEIFSFVESSTAGSDSNSVFPEHIKRRLIPKIEAIRRLLLSECIQTDPSEFMTPSKSEAFEVLADRELLGVFHKSYSSDEVVSCFVESKIYLWLIALIESSGGSISFGQVAAALHSDLLDDPAPHRVEVKYLVQKLFSWIKWAGPVRTRVSVSQPRYSEVMRLLN
jgi:hypothetical protein